MDGYEKIGYLCLGIVAALYALMLVIGVIAIFPFGVVGLLVIVGIGALLIKVLKEQLGDEEDKYYNDTVEK